ncbi:AI-2E family transporter [Neiella marina]|uniref:AI-2E family transporter n=1 Tax=Neiella holothuriorum TaxID=2870530 RepID=A0ABS7EK87_9GAMM|nr:AI-2E family transporter [Neiella holothuriorum]MBW8192751.1 AI-2E family transporter [Neiella holothuriorum]
MSAQQQISTYVEAALRIGIVALLIYWSFTIIQPFILVVVWGAIIAVALYPLFLKFRNLLGGNNKLASVLFTLIALAILLTPTAMLVNSTVDSAKQLHAKAEAGELNVPKPDIGVKDWPVIGEQVYEIWNDASQDLDMALERHQKTIEPLKDKAIAAVSGAGAGIGMFLVAIIISGVFMAFAQGCESAVSKVGDRLAGKSGTKFTKLASATIKSVAQGVLGVAFIQAMAGGLVMILAGIPAAGLWALAIMILSTIQLGIGITLIVIATASWAFSNLSMAAAIAYTVAMIVVALADNVLKPILMGRGVDVPMLVIFLGAIGGFISSGIIGLFTGAVILVITYEIFVHWLNLEKQS